VAKTGIHTTSAPQPAGPYSQGIEANGFLFTAGFGPQDPANGNAVADNVADQTRQVLRNVQAVLAERERIWLVLVAGRPVAGQALAPATLKGLASA